MPELAISTWSLHRELGPMYREARSPQEEREPNFEYGQGNLTLLELPARLAEKGIRNLEICHFHFPRTDLEYLQDLRRRLEAAGVRLLTLLIDSGDITSENPEARQHDMNWIRDWIEIAAQVGARRVRVIAGDAVPGPESIHTSVEGLESLARFAMERGVEVITENWFKLTMRPQNLLAVLDGLQGSVGLCADFGNYRGPGKYEDLKAILPRATSIHAKADFPKAGEMNLEDFQRCLDLSREAQFKGQYVLIFDGPGEEWPSLSQMEEVVRSYL